MMDEHALISMNVYTIMGAAKINASITMEDILANVRQANDCTRMDELALTW